MNNPSVGIMNNPFVRIMNNPSVGAMNLVKSLLFPEVKSSNESAIEDMSLVEDLDIDDPSESMLEDINPTTSTPTTPAIANSNIDMPFSDFPDQILVGYYIDVA